MPQPRTNSDHALWYSLLILPAADRQAGDDTTPEITGQTAAEEGAVYLVPLSPTGNAPATHYACCTLCTPQMLQGMQGVLQSGRLSTVRFYRWRRSDSHLVSTNSPQQGAILGQAWGPEQSLTDAGLVRVVEAAK